MKNKNDIDNIDDIVAMIDSFMSNDGGHMNITVDEGGDVRTDGELIEKSSVRFGCLDCEKNTACSVPTLFEGLDRQDDEQSE